MLLPTHIHPRLSRRESESPVKANGFVQGSYDDVQPVLRRVKQSQSAQNQGGSDPLALLFRVNKAIAKNRDVSPSEIVNPAGRDDAAFHVHNQIIRTSILE
jgi:hypothetical protein